MSSASSPLLDFRDVSRSFTVRQGVLGRVRGEVRAVDGVSLSVRRGETLGLVGESGCGKSTLARMAVRLLPPTGGEILFDGESVLPGVSGRNDTWYSRRLQMIFQDPFSSLNPRLRIGTSIAEPLMAIGTPAAERQERVGEILRRVGLQPGHAGRYPVSYTHLDVYKRQDPHTGALPVSCSLGGWPIHEIRPPTPHESCRTKPFSGISESTLYDTCTPRPYDLNFVIAS